MNPRYTVLSRRLLPMFLILLTLLSGCSGEKDVTFHDLTITLPAGFSRELSGEEDIDYYTSITRVQVALQRMTFLSLVDLGYSDPEQITTEDFRELIIESNGFDATLCEVDGILAFVHEFEGYNASDSSLGSEMYKSLCCVYKSDSSMWLVDFSVPVAHYDQWEADFREWATTVRFTGSDPNA